MELHPARPTAQLTNKVHMGFSLGLPRPSACLPPASPFCRRCYHLYPILTDLFPLAKTAYSSTLDTTSAAFGKIASLAILVNPTLQMLIVFNNWPAFPFFCPIKVNLKNDLFFIARLKIKG